MSRLAAIPLLVLLFGGGCADEPVPPAPGAHAAAPATQLPRLPTQRPTAPAGPACLAAPTAFSPPAWTPPRPATQACSASEIDGYWKDCLDAATALPVRCAQNVANHALCAACLSAEPAPAGLGPLVQTPGHVRANVAGCIALAQDDARPEGCGAREAEAAACAAAACTGCDPGDAEACEAAARSDACAAWQMRTCSELSVAAPCAAGTGEADRFRRVARVFCGG